MNTSRRLPRGMHCVTFASLCPRRAHQVRGGDRSIHGHGSSNPVCPARCSHVAGLARVVLPQRHVAPASASALCVRCPAHRYSYDAATVGSVIPAFCKSNGASILVAPLIESDIRAPPPSRHRLPFVHAVDMPSPSWFTFTRDNDEQVS